MRWRWSHGVERSYVVGWSPGVGVEPWGGGVVVLHTCHVLCTYIVLMLYVCYYVSGHSMCTVYCAL